MGRQPTPSHDAAHVLVSFQNGSSKKDKKRPLSLANATRPPENRRRVWRACESCRKKKIKCDGSDPCQCCLHTGSECIYAGDEDRRLWMGMGGNGCDESLAKRMQMLEDLVAKLVEDQRRLSEEVKCYKDGSGSGIIEMDSSQQDCSLELDEMGAAMPQEETPPVVLDQPSGNAIDPELVESASQKKGMAVPSAESGDAGAETADCAYTDAYGQIYDQGDDAQYVGMGASVAAVNECAGLRAHIRQRLLRRGCQLPESILNLRSLAANSPHVQKSSLPPVALMDVLIDSFFLNVYKLFPIIEADDFQRQYLVLLSRNEARLGFVPLLYTILAVSSSRQIPSGHPVWARDDCPAYKNVDLGSHFYSLAMSALGSNGGQLLPAHGTNINTVTALTLLGMYLTQAGLPSEAWTIVGQAVRLGQTIGLHRSPKRMGLPMLDVRRRCQLWWCLYVMDRLLSLHLGRSLAINDHDSDVQFPSARPSAPGFVAMTHLCRIIGRICTANSIENTQKWRDPLSESEARARMDELSAELHSWKQNMLPDGAGLHTTEQCVLMSSYCSAIHHLFRPLLPTPHWQSNIPGQAIMGSFHASIDCIRTTGDFIQNVPACHYFAFHGLNLFASIMGLLHCIRHTDSEDIVLEAEKQSQRGISLLPQMQNAWPLATHYKAIAEEYQELTREIRKQGTRGRCLFSQDVAALTAQETAFDPWREFAAQIDLESNIFPSMPDAVWMSELYHLSPTKSQLELEPELLLPDTPAIADEQPVPSKRRRLEKGPQPVCGFSLKRSR